MKTFSRKIGLVFLCVMSLICVGVLGACSVKDADIDFVVDEVVLSVGDDVDLSEYVKLTNLEQKNVVFKLSDSSIGEISGSTLKASKSGRTYLYATYNGSTVASVQLSVKAVFSTPTNFVLSDNEDNESATLSWDVVSGYFSGETKLTTADEYVVTYSRTTYDESDKPTVTTGEQVVTENSIVFEQGYYEVSVVASGKGYFDNSQVSATQKLYIGFMTELETSDFSWSDGVISWSAVSGATYSVVVNDAIVASELDVTSFDLSDILEASESDEISVQVKVVDETGEKYTTTSDKITITKLDNAVVEKSDGELVVKSVENATEYVVSVCLSGTDQTTTFTLDESLTFSLTGYDAGLYEVSVIAKNSSVTKESSQYFYQSKENIGMVYKLPAITLSGTGASEVGGSVLNLRVQTTNGDLLPVQVNLLISGSNVATLTSGSNATSFSYTISEAGSYDLVGVLTAYSQNYEVDQTSVYVLNSDDSVALEATKHKEFISSVTHEYVESLTSDSGFVSQFTFSAVEGATGYGLQICTSNVGLKTYSAVDSSLFEVTIDDGVTITFTEKIENLFSAVGGEFDFRVVTASDDDSATINSYVEKEIELLSAPESASNDVDDSDFNWTEVTLQNGGDCSITYKITYYKLTADQYSSQSLDVDTLENGVTIGTVGDEIETNSYVFATGYYYIKVWAISGNEDVAISSTSALIEKFYKRETLSAPTFSFGYDEDIEEPLGSASGYFLQIETDENAAEYAVSIDASSVGTKDAEESSTIFKFSEDFSGDGQTYSITVLAIGVDTTLYLQNSTTVNVTRLASVSSEQIEIEEFVQNPTLSVSNDAEGVSEVQIWQGEQNVASGTDSASVMLTGSGEFSFILKGSSLDADGLYLDEDGDVFLESAAFELSIARLSSAANLYYYDGNLVFDYDETAPYAFVLTIADSSSSTSLRVVIPVDDDFVQVFCDTETDSTSISVDDLGGSAVLSNSSNEYTLNLTNGETNLLSLILENATALGFYTNLSGLQFSIFAACEFDSTGLSSGDSVSISSLCALASGSGSVRYVEVKKLSSSSLTYENGKMCWTVTTVDGQEVDSSSTTYVLSCGDSEFQIEGTTTSYSVSSLGTYSLVAQNPYYLESASSNTVTLAKLPSVTSVTLKEDASLVIVYDEDSTHYAGFKINDAEATTNKTISSLSAGTLTIMVEGATDPISSSGDLTYYLDSDTTTWTISMLSSIMPTTQTISVASNTISWNSLISGGSPISGDNIEYVLVFSDGDSTAYLYTSETSLTWTEGSKLYDALFGLSGTEITLTIYAHVKSSSIASGNVIYFGDLTLSIDETNDSNFAQYSSTATITKYAAPTITEVDAEDEISGTSTTYKNTPDFSITFTGNYGTTADFLVTITDGTGVTSISASTEAGRDCTVTCNGSVSSGIYSYTLTITTALYNYSNRISADESFVVRIYALNSQDESAFPSDAGTLTITKASDVEISFADSDVDGYSSIVNITNTNSGEIVLVVSTDGGTTETHALVPYGTSTFDLSDNNTGINFLEKLSDGGTISIQAYARSVDSDVNSVILASSIATLTQDVLAEIDYDRTASGFSMTTTGSGTITYVITCGTDSFILTADSGSECEFEVPVSYQTGSSYTFSVQVFCLGYVNSAIATVEYSLSRLDAISSVSISRSDDVQSLSWGAVANASGYLIQVFLSSDTENVVFETTIATNKISLDDLLDADTTNTLTALTGDTGVYISISAVGGTTYNNSKSFGFYATILGNSTEANMFSVNSYGLIEFSGTLDNAYYLFNNNSVDTTWEQVLESGILDSSNLSGDYSYTVSIRYRGDSDTTSASESILLDSYIYTTVSSNPFSKISDILAISISNQDDSIAFGLGVSGAEMQFFVGLSQDAILTGDVQTFSITSDSNSYAYSLTDILELLEATDEGSVTLCFWTYNNAYSIVSNVKTFAIKNGTASGYVSTVKGVYTSADSDATVDYVNSYALFDYDSNTLGIYVSVTYTSTATAATASEDDGSEDEDGETEDGEGDDSGSTEDTETETTKTIKVFFTASEMIKINIKTATDTDSNTIYVLSDSTSYSYFSINLTTFFENYLPSYSGEFTLNFVRVSLSSDEYSISATETIGVYRIPAVSTVAISYGNVDWSSTTTDVNTENYYVYVSNTLDESDGSYEYAIFSTTHKFYEGTNLSLGTTNFYYVAVRAVNESDAFVIASGQTYKLDSSSQNPETVRKIQLEEDSLKLADGTLYFEFDITDSSILNAFATSSSVLDYYFTTPFSFTINQYIEEAVSVRFEFTSTSSNGKTYYVDVPISYLLRATEDTVKLWELILISGGAGSGITFDDTTESKINSLIYNEDAGVASYSSLFDDFFESVQAGAYSLRYCVIGVSTNFNSCWQDFSSTIYVTAQPSTSVTKTTSDSMNTFKVSFNKAEVATDTSGSTSYASSYILRFRLSSSSSDYYAFQITYGSSSWSMTQIGVENSDSISVSESGDTLSFYINYNSGKSLLGVFGSLFETSQVYQMEIYAVGNNVAISSKSGCNFVTLLALSNFEVVDGAFTWTTTNAQATTIMYREYQTASFIQSTLSSRPIFSYSLTDSSMSSATQCEVKFIVQGSISGATVLIDSPVYYFSSVYSLTAPSVSGNLGQISIDGTNNETAIDNSYMGSEYTYRYKVSNNNIADVSYTSLTLDVDEIETLYEIGTAGLVASESNSTYVYKSTESGASEFYVSMIGSTCELEFEQDASSYYIQNVTVSGSSGSSIALTSLTATLNAEMLDDSVLSESGIDVSDGVFVWTDLSETLGSTISEDYTIVYRLYIERYSKSYSASGDQTNDTNDKYNITVYTTKTSFDPSLLTRVDEYEGSYMSITIQAFAALISEEDVPNVDYVELVEGGYAYSNATYTNGSIVLMGNGGTLTDVVRLPSIDESSIEVNSGGKLTWELELSDFVTSKDNFESNFEFIVLNENDEEIQGEYQIVEEGSILKVVFYEDEGQLEAGEHSVSIYVNLKSGYTGSTRFVKSYVTAQVTVTKLATITGDDYEVVREAVTAESGGTTYLEYISFEEFFEQTENINLVVSMTVNSDVYTFTKSASKLYIASTEGETFASASGFIASEGGNSASVLIESSIQVTFVVSGQDMTGTNCLTSDTSDALGILRAGWDDDSEILWDSDLQEFTWESLWRTIDGITEGTLYTATFENGSTLYSDSSLETSVSGMTLDTQNKIVLMSISSKSAKILYQRGIYYISLDAYSVVATAEATSLEAGTLFTVLSEGEETSLICTYDGVVCTIATEAIVSPEYVVNITTAGETRTYTVKENSFQPPVVGEITAFSVQITFGSRQIASKFLSYKGSEAVSMTLFESGSGTSDDPYIISSQEQFMNISLRMTKESYYATYTVDGETKEEEEFYYFTVSDSFDFDLGTVSGIVFSGEFSGVLVGNGSSITYTSTGVQTLQESQTIESGQTKVYLTTSSSSIVYTSGSALFEKFTDTAKVSGLTINATFSSDVAFNSNALVSALVLVNLGTVSNVTVTNFETNFHVTTSSASGVGVIAFGGVVGINRGTITSSKLSCDISITDETFVTCVGGIAYTNFASISACTVEGNITVSKSTSAIGSLQVGGFASANVESSATISYSVMNAKITVSCSTSDNTISCYAGVFVGAKINDTTGSISNCTSGGSLTCSNVTNSNS